MIRPLLSCLAHAQPMIWRSIIMTTTISMTYMAALLRPNLTNMGRIAHMPVFLLYALCAGLLLALVAGPLGSFVVWRRMAYFGDTLAHSTLFGVALGLLFDINLALAV